jgi:hypothetical protein
MICFIQDAAEINAHISKKKLFDIYIWGIKRFWLYLVPFVFNPLVKCESYFCHTLYYRFLRGASSHSVLLLVVLLLPVVVEVLGLDIARDLEICCSYTRQQNGADTISAQRKANKLAYTYTNT